jgi:hypothetical protein
LKKLSFVYILSFLCTCANAQSWQDPIIIESLTGSGGNTGDYSSMQIVSGNPAIAFYDVSHSNLMYVRALDTLGALWGTPLCLDDFGQVGLFNSMEIINGFPAIVYYDEANENLKYVRALDAIGSSWGLPVTIDEVGNIAFKPSLKEVNGNPAIAYYDATIKDIKFVRSVDEAGAIWATPQTIDGSSTSCRFASLIVVNGNPSICYHNLTNSDQMFIRATDASGIAWAAPIVVDAAVIIGGLSTMQIINGNPAIAYNGSNLRYLRANDISGSSWGEPLNISNFDVGISISMQVVDGKPAIAYFNGDLYDCEYVWAADIDGNAWQGSITIEGDALDIGGSPSLEVVGGKPAISYYDATNGDLKFAIRSEGSSLMEWQSVQVDVIDDVGKFTSQQIVNGNPAIAYYDVTNGDLKYTRSTDVNGVSWSQEITIGSSSADVGQFCSLFVVNGNPAISYYDATSKNLNYVRALDPDGASWAAPTFVDVTGDVGQHTSLAIINGNPAISYYDVTNTNLKYVRANDASGYVWGTPFTVQSNSTVGLYTSLAEVNGNPAIAYSTFNESRYIRATDANGTAWGQYEEVAYSGSHNCLKVIDGNPAITLAMVSSSLSAQLVYNRSMDINGTDWSNPIIIDQQGDVGRFSSLTVINGNPAISYYDGASQKLKYTRSQDVSGNVWPQSSILAELYYASGQYTSLQNVNGSPGISYYDNANKDLKFIRASDSSGIAFWNIHLASDVPGESEFTSMKLINNNPAVSFYDKALKELKYVRAANSIGASWNEPVVADTTTGSGEYNSLASVNGNPAISYYDDTNRDLKYVRAVDSDGATWGTPVTLDASGTVGMYTSLQVVNGNPAISYYKSSSVGSLKYIRALDANGNAWDTPITIESGGIVGLYSSLMVVNGKPAISYYDNTNGNLKYVRALDADGLTWGAGITLDVTGNVGQYISLQIVNGNPAISYFDINNNDLKYVRAVDSDGVVWNNSIAIDVPDNAGKYTSLQVINGKPAISYFDNTNFALKFVRASDANGSIWNESIAVDPNERAGFFTSMLPIDSGAGISYIKDGLLYFIYGTCDAADTPIPSASDSSICIGQNTTLNIAGGSLNGASNWNWYTDSCAGTYLGTGASISISPTTTTTYYVRGEGGCSAQGTDNCANITIIVNPLPTALCSNTGPYCLGDAIQLSSELATTYSWSGPLNFVSSNQNALINSATSAMSGTYTLTVINENGCSATATTAVDVQVPIASSTNTGPYCVGSNISLNSSGGTEYSWSGPLSYTSGVQNPILPESSVAMSGEYIVTVTNAIGCTATNTTTVVVNESAFVNLGPDINQQNPPALLDAGTGFSSYLWSTNQTSQIISVTTSGQYSVTVSNGCTDSDTIQVEFAVDIENVDGTTIGVNLYPNPTNDCNFNLSIEQLKAPDLSFEIIDLQGRLLYEKFIGRIDGDILLPISLPELAVGSYVFKLNANNTSAKIIFVVNK